MSWPSGSSNHNLPPVNFPSAMSHKVLWLFCPCAPAASWLCSPVLKDILQFLPHHFSMMLGGEWPAQLLDIYMLPGSCPVLWWWKTQRAQTTFLLENILRAEHSFLMLPLEREWLMMISWAFFVVIFSFSSLPSLPSSSVSASNPSKLCGFWGESMVTSTSVGETSRDESITSGSLISSIFRAIPGGDQSGFVQKNSSNVLFRAAFRLWIVRNSPLTVKSWIALSMTLSSCLDTKGRSCTTLAWSNTYSFQHTIPQWEVMSHPISLLSLAYPWVDPHWWVVWWRSLHISHCCGAKLSQWCPWPPWGESFLPLRILARTMAGGNGLHLYPELANSQGDPRYLGLVLMQHEKWARRWCRKSMLKQRWHSWAHHHLLLLLHDINPHRWEPTLHLLLL